MNNIFENVQFIGDKEIALNEFVVSMAELISIIGAVLVTAGVGFLIEPIPAKEKRKVNNALLVYASKNNTVKEFNKKASKLESISTTTLFEKIDSGSYNAKLSRALFGGIKAYAIFDSKNNIMAYALFSSSIKDGYAYKICDKSFKSTPELNLFVKASFENAANIFGPALHKILKFNLTTFNKDEDISDADKKLASIVTYNEYLQSLGNIQFVFDKLVDKLRYIVNSKYKDSYPNGVELVDRDIEFWKQSGKTMKKVLPRLVAYLEYDFNDDEFDEDSTDVIIKSMANNIKSIGFEIESDYDNGDIITSSLSNKYPNIVIELRHIAGHNEIELTVRSTNSFIIK